MEGGTKIVVAAVLVVAIAFGGWLILRNTSIVGGGPRPPDWVLEQQIEKIDMKTGEVIAKQLQEWEKLGNKEGAYKNPSSGDYTMVGPMQCGACQAKIPAPMAPKELDEKGPEARMEWEKTVKCPKCGKNPFVMATPPPAR